jgi:hypothetical protein
MISVLKKYISILLMLTAILAFDFGPNVHVGFTASDQKFPDIDIENN